MAEHRETMFARSVAALIRRAQIVMMLPKSKDLRPVGEKLVISGMQGGLHARRQVMAQLRDETQVKKLLGVLAKRHGTRSGGYLRIMRAGFRYGDQAPWP